MSVNTSNSNVSADRRPSGACELRVLRNAGELAAIAPEWERFVRYPNAHPDFFNLINSLRESVLRPHVIVARRDGVMCGLLVGRLVEQEFTCSVGYKTFSCGKVRQLDLTHGGAMGECAGETANLMVDELIAALRRGEADLVNLSFADAAGDLFRAVRRRPGFFSRDRVVLTQLHWKAKLPQSMDEFLRRLNKKHRYWLRRIDKLLNGDFPGRVAYKRFGDYPTVKELADDLELVAARTYQRKLGAGFMQGDEHLKRLEFGRQQGWARGVLLFIDGRPCAFWMGSVYRNVFHSEATGYDPDYRKYELGTLVFMKLLEDLCGEKVEAIDFGLGDASYKRRFGDEHWDEGLVRIYAPSLTGLRLNLVRTLLEGSAMAARKLVVRFGLEQKLKTLWRKKLAGGQESSESGEGAAEKTGEGTAEKT